jgi:hypothetical protein
MAGVSRSAKTFTPKQGQYLAFIHHHVQIGGENYVISGDGYLMPARKGQPAPDLRHFGQAAH